MRHLIAISLLALSACAAAPQRAATPEEAAARGGAAFTGGASAAPADGGRIVCPGGFPDSIRFEDAREGVPAFFCD